MKSFGFDSRYKLTETDDFSSVFSFRRRFSGIILIFHYMPNTSGHSRLGLVVAKKVTRSAVERNYMKRVLREWYRLNRHRFGSVDLVIRTQKTFGPAGFREVGVEFERAIAQICKRSQAVTA